MPAEKILIVEDEQLTAGAMTSWLEKLGYNITQTVSTGEEAIRSAEHCKPDLVLMDIHLEGKMDGIEAASQIRFGSNIPVVFVTGDADDCVLERSKFAEPVGFIAKPFSAKELRNTIETGLNNYRSMKKRKDEALQATEMRYRNLFENAVQGIFRSTRSGRFVDVNASFAGVMGYSSPKELLDSAGEAIQFFVSPERHRELLDALEKMGFVNGFEFEAYRKDGTIIWLSQNTRSIQDPGSEEQYFEGTVQDITGRKSTEKNLKSLLARQAALLVAVPDIIMEVNVNRVYTWANSGGFEFFGNDVIGKEASYYFEGEQNTYDSVHPLWEGDERIVYVESLQRRKDGQKRLLAWHCHTLKDYQGRVVGALSSARDITDGRRAQEELRQSEERFRLIAEHINEVFWISEVESDRITYVSPAFERIWGFSRQSIYEGKDSFRNAIYPEDRERVTGLFALQINGQPIEQEYRIVRPDGSIRHIWDRGFPVTGENGCAKRYVGVAQDITAWRQAEEEAMKSRQYLNQIINRMGDPVFVIDRQHKFVLVNDAMCALTETGREQLLGKTVRQLRLKKGEADSIWKEECLVFKSGKDSITEEETTTAQGDTHIIVTKKNLLTDNDGNSQIVGVIRDITDMKKAERDRAAMEIQLRQGQKLEAIGQLAAGIAHEINTPTQFVSDNTRFLQDAYDAVLPVLETHGRLLEASRVGNVDPALIADVEASIAKADLDYLMEEAPKAIRQSLEGLDRIATIVRAMKEFSHPGGEGKQLIDLNHAIENTIIVCRNEWKYVAEMAMDLDRALPPVPCLPGDFNQVILNLVVNAAHAIGEATHADEKRKGTISISTRHDKDWVEIRIGDTGTGIPEKHRAKIFTPFFTTKEVGRGTGQGLAISHSVIVGKHGGRINFETETGKGTVFVIRLPLHSDSIQ
jgi:PAS domain S-box-containing protein